MHTRTYTRTHTPTKSQPWQQWAEEQLGGLQAALAGKLEERAKEANDRLDVLKGRVDTLEEVRAIDRVWGGRLCQAFLPLPTVPLYSLNGHQQQHQTGQFFGREKERLLGEVDAKASELSQALAAFQEGFDAERRERLEREGRVLRQLGEHEQEVARRFEEERVSEVWFGMKECVGGGRRKGGLLGVSVSVVVCADGTVHPFHSMAWHFWAR